MAYDLQAGFKKLRASDDDLTPTYEREAALSRDNNKDDKIVQPETNGLEGAGQADDLGIWKTAISASETDLGYLSHTVTGDHATAPVDVPWPAAAEGADWAPNNSHARETSYQETSSLEEFMRNRRPSISFHPEVTLESGHHRGLEEPLPKLTVNTKLRKGSILHDLERHRLRSPLHRIHSEADCRNYNPLTGELLNPASKERRLEATHNSLRYPLLQPIAYSLPSHQQPSDSEQGASLTSESTASPLASEVQTPTDSVDMLVSPISVFPPFTYPSSLEDSSAWPKPRRQGSSSRAKSYNFERVSSMRSAQRQSSRSSRRSTSSSISPATAFLSRFATKEELAPEPDNAGQEVGEYVLGKQVGSGGFSTVKEAYTLEGDERICRAVKIVRKQLPAKDEIENESIQAEFEHEVGLWRCLGHRNILPLIEVYVTSFATFCFTKMNTGGTLYDLVRANRQGIGRLLARRYAYQLASAIRYLHEDVRVVHRDIKLENCLIDISDPDTAKDGGNLLLCDFGLADFFTNDTRSNSPDPYRRPTDRPPSRNIGPSDTSISIAGSLQYASPELIMSPAGFLSPVVDVWAFGVVIYALLVGDLPFRHAFQPRVQMMILAGEWNVKALEVAPGVLGYEDEVLELVNGCLEMRSEHRWKISQVLGCRWLKGCQEMLEELNESWKL